MMPSGEVRAHGRAIAKAWPGMPEVEVTVTDFLEHRWPLERDGVPPRLDYRGWVHSVRAALAGRHFTPRGRQIRCEFTAWLAGQGG